MNDHGESSTNSSSNIMSIIRNSKNKTPQKKVKRKTLTGLEKKLFVLKRGSILILRWKRWLSYINQDCENELDVDITFLSNLRKLKRIIETKHQNALRQTSILSLPLINKVYTVEPRYTEVSGEASLIRYNEGILLFKKRGNQNCFGITRFNCIVEL